MNWRNGFVWDIKNTSTCQDYLSYIAGGEAPNEDAVEEQLKGGLGNQDKKWSNSKSSWCKITWMILN